MITTQVIAIYQALYDYCKPTSPTSIHGIDANAKTGLNREFI